MNFKTDEVSLETAFNYYFLNKEFRELLSSGNYSYVNNKFKLNSDDREHFLTFEIVTLSKFPNLQKNFSNNIDSYIKRVSDTFEIHNELEKFLKDNNYFVNIENAWEVIDACTKYYHNELGMVKEDPKDFVGLTNMSIDDRKLLYQPNKRKGRNITKQFILAFCASFNFTSRVADIILSKSGLASITSSNSIQDRAYSFALDALTEFDTIDKNKFLKSNYVEPFGRAQSN